MKNHHRTVVLAIFLLGVLIGVSYAVNIVRSEGWEGLWDRKTDFIERTQPGAEPVIDRVEERF